MTQLILDATGEALNLPETRNGGYTVTETPLSRDAEMVSGRMTRELRGRVYHVSYQYGVLTEEEKDALLELCRQGWNAPITCSILPPGGGSLVQSEFFVTEFPSPRYLFSRKDGEGAEVPMWGDFRLSLREVRPHD